MNQQELNQLFGLLSKFNLTMTTDKHTMEDLHAVMQTKFIVQETEPNS